VQGEGERQESAIDEAAQLASCNGEGKGRDSKAVSAYAGIPAQLSCSSRMGNGRARSSCWIGEACHAKAQLM
jgi:hypothetical protein